MRHDPSLRVPQSAHENRKVLTVHIGCTIGRTVRTCLIGIVVSTTVRDCAISGCEFWKLFAPHSVVLQTAVNKYDGVALACLYVGDFVSVDGDPPYFVSHGQTAKNQSN